MQGLVPPKLLFLYWNRHFLCLKQEITNLL
nr:MAG TPA: hypothetical protein [Caudoviricetes sp.]